MSRPIASIRQPAAMARARTSACPSASRSACQDTQLPDSSSHHTIGVRSWSPISEPTVIGSGSAGLGAAGATRAAEEVIDGEGPVGCPGLGDHAKPPGGVVLPAGVKLAGGVRPLGGVRSRAGAGATAPAVPPATPASSAT